MSLFGAVADHYVAAAADYRSTILADLPLCYLRLGEASGSTAADSSGNSHPGIYANSPTLGVAGLLNGDSDTAVTFNGSQFVSVSNSSHWADVTTTYSIEVWFKTSASVSSVPVLCAQYDNSVSGPVWQLLLTTSGAIQFNTFIGTNTGNNILTTSVSGLNDGQPHHALVALDASSIAVYADGVSRASTASVASHNGANGNALSLAERIFLSSEHRYNGTLDEFAFYGAALSSARAAAHFNAGH